jgi:DNA-binding transcriptional LysR family regulator
MAAVSEGGFDETSETFETDRSMASDTLGLERLDLNRLVTFLVIAETGGVSAAARRLALTRSAISHSLCSLEASLGVTLFHRVGKSLVLTQEGKRLRGAVRDARDRIGAPLDAVTCTQEVRGLVRVGLFLGFSRLRLAAVVADFAAGHPGARVRVSYGPQAWLLEELRAGRLDLALSLRPLAEQRAQIRSRRLFDQTLVAASSRSARSASSTTNGAIR